MFPPVLISVMLIVVMICANFLAKKLMPPPAPQVLTIATIAPVLSPAPEPTAAPLPLLLAADDFYQKLKNKNFAGAAQWFGQQNLISDQSIAQAVEEMQFIIDDIDTNEIDQVQVGVRATTKSILQNQSTISLPMKAKKNEAGKWLFEPIGPVKIIPGTAPVKFSGTQKKSDTKVTGSLAVKKVILGFLPQSARESIFGAWVLLDGKFTNREPIKRVHFEEGPNFYAADPYFEKKKSESGESGDVWDFIKLDPVQVIEAKSLTFTITDLFSSPEFVIGATPTEIDTKFSIEVPLQ